MLDVTQLLKGVWGFTAHKGDKARAAGMYNVQAVLVGAVIR